MIERPESTTELGGLTRNVTMAQTIRTLNGTGCGRKPGCSLAQLVTFAKMGILSDSTLPMKASLWCGKRMEV
jgi:hypothetical protein